MTTCRMIFTLVALAGTGIISTPQPAWADEGGLGVYVPGVYGNLGMAMLPPEGFYLFDFPLFASLDTPIATRAGDLHLDIKAALFTNTIMPLWLTDKKVFGGKYAAGFGIVTAWLEVDSTVLIGDLEPFEQRDSNVGFGDAYAVPFMVSWRKKNNFFVVYEGINVPLGEYADGACCNLGLNHWAFDTNFSYTYHPEDRLVELGSGGGPTLSEVLAADADTFIVSNDSAVIDLANAWLDELTGTVLDNTLMGFDSLTEIPHANMISSPESPPMVPLPAPLWLATVGLFAVVFGRKKLRRLAGT